MPNFVRSANPIWFFVDLFGQPLNDEYWISFLTNTMPYTAQPVFQDNQGMTPWSDPLQFYPNGTLPDNLYFEDDLVYRLEVRHGPLQSDPLIYAINNFIPDNGGGTSNSSSSQENQITNPQFINVDFTIQPSVDAVNKSLSIKTAGTYQIGPDWFLTLTGSGTATVSQIIYSGDQNTTSDPTPPYSLKINTNGWTTAVLYQRFNDVGAIWSNTFISMSILARSDNDVASPVTLNYAPSSPGTLVPITSAPLSTGAFQIVQGVIALPTSTNTTLNNLAYVDMQIVIAPTGVIELSDVQVMGQNSLLPTNFVVAPDETPARQLDHEFHYYANSLITQPKDSLLTGWNFPLNPFQFKTTSVTTISAACSYIADQTILYQTVTSSVASGKASFANNSALQIQAVGASNIFALIQYIDPSTIQPYWGSILSSLVKAKLISAVSPTIVKFKMRLIYRTSLPSTLSASEPIASFDTNGDPVFSAGWTALKPLNDPAYVLGSSLDRYSFDSFQMPANSSATMTLGIVVYTTSSMSTVTPDACIFEEISLVPNQFAIESNPKTWDQTLRECQFYFESSYEKGVIPGTVSSLSQYQVDQTIVFDSGDYNLYAEVFDIQYKNVKRGIPSSITLYSPSSGTSGDIDVGIYKQAVLTEEQAVVSVNWSPITIGTKSVQYAPTGIGLLVAAPAAITDGASGYARFQYLIDSRLGV